MPSFIVSAIVSFFSTTLDDFAVMLYFFSRASTMMVKDSSGRTVDAPHAEKRMAYVKVMAGQTIGFSIVIVISLIGLLLGLLIPEDYVDLIGFIPIVAGLMSMHEMLDEGGCLDSCPAFCRGEKKDDEPSKQDPEKGTYSKVDHDETELAATKGPNAAVTSFQNKDVTAPEHMHNDDAVEAVEAPVDVESEGSFLGNMVKSCCASCVDPFTLEVIVMALAVSSDNIAIYISIFATEKHWEVFLTIVFFYLLLGLNIIIAGALMQCKQVAECFENYAKYFIPFFLVGLGIYILSDSVVFGK